MGAFATPLVGRAPELDDVDRALVAARTGTAVVLEVVGSPGIGKPRLLAELAERAERAGFDVYSGRGGEPETSRRAIGRFRREGRGSPLASW